MIDNDLCETSQPTLQSNLNRSGRDKFILVLNLPHILKKQSTTNELLNIDKLQISVHGAVVPTIQIPANEIRFAGQTYNVSSFSRPNYQPLRVNFVIDNTFQNYWILWKWLTILNDPRDSVYTGTDPKLETYKDKIQTGLLTEYQSNFSIFGLNEYNQKTIEFVYTNAFITSLGEINYSYRENDLIESTAEFQFSQLQINLSK